MREIVNPVRDSFLDDFVGKYLEMSNIFYNICKPSNEKSYTNLNTYIYYGKSNLSIRPKNLGTYYNSD